MKNIIHILEKEFKIEKKYIENIINLIDKGNTIPFIARYRKELTFSMDDQNLRKFYERLIYLRNLEEKRNNIKNIINSKGKLTKEILLNLENAKTISEIDDIYMPFKDKKRTKATIAKEQGLEEIATILFKQDIKENIENLCKNYINKEKNINNIADVLQGAKDIIAEIIAENYKIRKIVRDTTINLGYLISKKSKKEEPSVYEKYYDFKEKLKYVKTHRVLALNRGEREGFLKIKIEIEKENLINNLIYLEISKKNKYTDYIIKDIIKDSYKRLIAPSIEREIRANLTELSQEESIKLFGKNLRHLLLQKPIKGKIVLAIDPGFRTGCKIAILDETGKVLKVGVIYPTEPNKKIAESRQIIENIIKKYNIDIIAIGNGTASKETEIFIVDLLNSINIDKKIDYLIINESGASIYSASKIGAEEFPNFDVSLRSAISIGRRLQDPLAELVKIDPKNIGVGQYQHDMNQKKLSETLKGVVESCVNTVGVDLNTASLSLLSYISGITKLVAKNILDYRNKNGKFKKREELLKVNKLGNKIYEQCAGFLRISLKDAENPLDSTGIHPESYKNAKIILKKLNYTLEDIKNKKVKNENIKYEALAKEIYIGIPTLEYILKEFENIGIDIRENIKSNILRKDIINIKDLKKGIILEGIVRNITDFGAFIDIGLHEYGLVHISNMSKKFIKHPLDILNIGDLVKVEVLDIDLDKNKIFLNMKDIDTLSC